MAWVYYLGKKREIVKMTEELHVPLKFHTATFFFKEQSDGVEVAHYSRKAGYREIPEFKKQYDLLEKGIKAFKKENPNHRMKIYRTL